MGLRSPTDLALGYSTGASSLQSGGGMDSNLLQSFKRAEEQSRTANLKRAAQIESIFDEIIARYQPGGAFGKGFEANLAAQKEREVGGGMQQLISSGLFGTTSAAGLGRRFEAEVGAPARLKLEDIQMERLSGAQTGKAGFLERINEPGPDYSALYNAAQAGGASGGGRAGGGGSSVSVADQFSQLDLTRSRGRSAAETEAARRRAMNIHGSTAGGGGGAPISGNYGGGTSGGGGSTSGGGTSRGVWNPTGGLGGYGGVEYGGDRGGSTAPPKGGLGGFIDIPDFVNDPLQMPGETPKPPQEGDEKLVPYPPPNTGYKTMRFQNGRWEVIKG